MPRTPRQTKHSPHDGGGSVGKPRGNYRQYTDAEKAEALVALEANGGNVKGTARALGIPEPTLRLWSLNQHVNKDVVEIQDEKRIDFTHLLEAEILAALGAMHGKRDDASYADMARTIGIFTDKLELLRGNATSRMEVNGSLTLTDLLNGGE